MRTTYSAQYAIKYYYVWPAQGHDRDNRSTGMKPKAGRAENGVTIVPPEGPRDARIMLIGQNPGAEEARQKRPFVGRSGRFLDDVLRRHGIDRRTLYITSVVKETTPGNRTPTREEIERGMPRLIKEIRQVKPQTIVLMGKVASQVPRFAKIRYIETCHPAAAMRFPAMREKFETAFQELVRPP
jgi:uracil-DNA glycosylase